MRTVLLTPHFCKYRYIFRSVISLLLWVSAAAVQLAGMSVDLGWFLDLSFFPAHLLHLISWMTSGWILLTLFVRLRPVQWSALINRQPASGFTRVYSWFCSSLLLQWMFISALSLSSSSWQNTIKGWELAESCGDSVWFLFFQKKFGLWFWVCGY